MGRTRRRRRAGKTSGGALTSLRGGFRSAARRVTGTGSAQPTRGAMSNVVTVLLAAVAVGVLLWKLGILHR